MPEWLTLMAGMGSQMVNFGTTAASNWLTAGLNQKLAEVDRVRNYELSQKAAKLQDLRTRNMYNDIYSPKALLKQYQKAGLSPSMLFSGTPGQGGMQAASGAGASSGPQTAPMQAPDYLDLAKGALAAAEIKRVNAETENIKANTRNTDVDTERQEIQREVERLSAGQFEDEWTLVNSLWEDEATGEKTSLFEAAGKSSTYEDFMKWCRDGKSTPDRIKAATTTEAGQRVLRQIYENARKFDTDIMVLAQEKVSSYFQLQIVQAMNDSEFAKLNAEAAVAYLKANIETASLTIEQKGAWNNLIDRLEKTNPTMKDIVLVLGMIVNQAMSNWHMPKM